MTTFETLEVMAIVDSHGTSSAIEARQYHGDDADRYQEREVRDALIELEKTKQRGQD
jgi:hypothetical protein